MGLKILKYIFCIFLGFLAHKFTWGTYASVQYAALPSCRDSVGLNTKETWPCIENKVKNLKWLSYISATPIYTHNGWEIDTP